MGRPAKVDIAAPPEQEDLLEQIKRLQVEVDEKNKHISEQDEKIHSLEYTISTDLMSFESKIKAEEQRIAREFSDKISTFPKHRTTIDRDYSGASGQRLTKAVADKSKWTDEQRKLYRDYEDAMVELDTLRRTTLIAVTLIDDPDVADGQLNCGVNGQVMGVFYSSDYMVDGAKEGRRVQLVPYTHYEAVTSSYKVRFKPITDAAGREGHLPYKLSPVVEASLATEEQIAQHKQKLRLGNKRRNMEMVG